MKLNLFFVVLINILLSSTSYSCPTGWEIVKSTNSSSEFCIESETIQGIKAHEAHILCEEKEAKVCSTEQWVQACTSGTIRSQGWEWSVSLGQYTSIVGNNDCGDIGFGELSPVANLRCCK